MLRPRVRFLRPFFALLLLVVFAELSSLTFAQLRTDCIDGFESGDGRLTLRLNSTAAPGGGCANVNYPTGTQPGDVIPACYSGTALSNPNVTLTSLTLCTVCTVAGPGCNIYFPPPNPVPTIDPSLLPPIPTLPLPIFPPILPNEPPPPPIGIYYWDPYDPWNTMDPDDPYFRWHWHGCLAD